MQNMDISTMSLDDAVIASLRRCGHFLHHSASGEKKIINQELAAALTEEEKKMLTALLQKCLNSWNNL